MNHQARPTRFRLPAALRATAGLLLAAAAMLLPAARAQNDTGGTGTIDPNTVNTREVVRDGSLIADSHEILDARYLNSDAAGNLYVGAIATRRDTIVPSSRALISKYAPSGALLWRHEGATTDDFKVPGAPADPFANVDLAAMDVDAAGNVVVAFNTLTYSSDFKNNPVNPRALIVGYDPNGRLRWRDLTGGQSSTTPPNAHNGVRSVVATPDGGALALIANTADHVSNVYDREATVVVRLAPNGAERFTTILGTVADALVVLPLALADDGAGNAFLLTREGRYEDGPPGLIGVGTNVVRRLGPTGSVLARATATTAESATDAWVEARTDAAGNLYIAGNFRRNRTNATSGDGRAGQLLLAFNPDLSPRWRALGPQPAQAAEEQPTVQVRGLRLSPGGITVGGRTLSDALLGSGSDQHWEVTRFAYADGAVRWHRLYQSTAPTNGSRLETVTNLQVDAADNVYAVGYRSAAPRNELVLIKYSGVGDTQFIKPFPAADQKFNPNDQSFGLTGDGRPAFLSPSDDGKQAVVLTFDNPAVVPVTGSSHPAFFNGESALSNGVYYLQFPGGNPFGFYSYLADSRYLYHFDLGYEFVFDANDGKNGVYLYDFQSGSFFYTSPSFPFPYLYDFSLNATLYYYPDIQRPGSYTTGPRYFYNTATKQIITK